MNDVADCPGSHDYGWLCTQNAGHPGPHIAEGLSNVLCVWDDTYTYYEPRHLKENA